MLPGGEGGQVPGPKVDGLAGREGTAQVTEGDFATLLDRRLKRLEEMKLIEANGAKVIEAQPQPVETKPPLARTNDRRFRCF